MRKENNKKKKRRERRNQNIRIEVNLMRKEKLKRNKLRNLSLGKRWRNKERCSLKKWKKGNKKSSYYHKIKRKEYSKEKKIFSLKSIC